jgi:hypothetical protein
MAPSLLQGPGKFHTLLTEHSLTSNTSGLNERVRTLPRVLSRAPAKGRTNAEILAEQARRSDKSPRALPPCPFNDDISADFPPLPTPRDAEELLADNPNVPTAFRSPNSSATVPPDTHLLASPLTLSASTEHYSRILSVELDTSEVHERDFASLTSFEEIGGSSVVVSPTSFLPSSRNIFSPTSRPSAAFRERGTRKRSGNEGIASSSRAPLSSLVNTSLRR